MVSDNEVYISPNNSQKIIFYIQLLIIATELLAR